MAGVAARIALLTETAGALEQEAAWEEDAPQRAEDRARGRASATAARERASSLRAELAALPDRTAAAERDLDAARIAAARLPAAAEALTTARARVAAVREYTEAATRLRTAEQAAQAAAVTAAAAAAAVTEALGRYRALGDQQRAERAAFLAEGLEPGQPCPVCGATEHPAPARAADGLVTDEQVRQAGEEDERCRREQADADEAARVAAEEVQAAGLAAAELAAKAGDVDETEALAALARVEADHESARLAHDSLDALERGVRDLREQETVLGAAIAEAEREAAAVDARVDEQEVAERERTERISAAVGEESTATAALAAVRARLVLLRAAEAADAAYARAAAAVPADLRDRGLAEARQVAQDATTASEAAQARHRAAVAASARLQALLDNATPLADEWAQALQRSAVVDESTRGVIELAAMASGGNARRLSLSSYALMRRFESVLGAASQHLARMSGGRFTFTLDAEAGQGQAGLGIAVIDGWSGRAQEPKSLSGGETFYAALALALGLADVVRSEAGGSPLETLFIDEGFGSLDQDTLGNVMQQLDTLRSGSRVVGVISHVTEMKDSIHAGISVRRGDDRTSTIGRLRE
jgi:exonuclease SbcC